MCDGPAVYLVRSHRGDEPLCDECIRYRHRGDDFSLLEPTSGPCACSHQPAKLAQDRRHGRHWRGELCPLCGAREMEDCTAVCTSPFNRQRSGEFWDCLYTAKRMGIAADWLQAQQQTRAFPDRWIAAATWELAKGA